MPGGGKLTIGTGNRFLDAADAPDRDLPPGRYVTLRVTDDGVGMAPDVVARAFDPLFATKPIGAGTGFGLSMIYGFAHQSVGRAHIRSVPGRGATICLHLPFRAGAGPVEVGRGGDGAKPCWSSTTNRACGC